MMFVLKKPRNQTNINAQRIAILRQIAIKRQNNINAYRKRILEKVNKQYITEESGLEAITEEPIVEFIDVYQSNDETNII